MRKSGFRAAPGNPGYLMYEDTARYDGWLKLILGVVLLATFIAGICPPLA